LTPPAPRQGRRQPPGPGKRRAVGRPKDGDSAETRQQILDAAIEVFGSKGFKAATIVEIAQRVGLTPPTLYHHFKSKPALFAAAAAELMDRVSDAWSSRVDPRLDLRENLIRLVQASVALGGENRLLSQFALSATVDPLRDPEVREQLDSLQGRPAELLVELIEKTRHGPGWAPSIATDRLVNVINVILYGLTVSHTALTPEQYVRLGDDLVSLLDGSLLPDQRPGRRGRRRSGSA
jgi:AcrR family transcriptional regulator